MFWGWPGWLIKKRVTSIRRDQRRAQHPNWCTFAVYISSERTGSLAIQDVEPYSHNITTIQSCFTIHTVYLYSSPTISTAMKIPSQITSIVIPTRYTTEVPNYQDTARFEQRANLPDEFDHTEWSVEERTGLRRSEKRPI